MNIQASIIEPPSRHRRRIPHTNRKRSAASTTKRLPRALSSPSRSAGNNSPKVRARSPSLCPSPFKCPSPQPFCRGDAIWPAVGGEIKRAYFSALPPPAPMWLTPLHAPPPAPLLATLPSQQPTLCISSAVNTTCEKENSTEENEYQRLEASVETSNSACGGVDILLLSRSTNFSLPSVPPRDAAVQTPRNVRTSPGGEQHHVSYDKSREWLGRLRDGHVRLALRALRQLRRAERLHRALVHSPCSLFPARICN